MPLNKLDLQNSIESLLEDMVSRTEDPEKARKDFATELSTIIDSYIRSATITVPAGITVQTVPSTGTGATIAPITALIS